MTEQELIALYFDEGKTNYAFNLLVRKYSQKLYWQIRRIVLTHEDANDVLQNSFIKIWKGLPKFRQDSSLTTWMFRIANNEALNHIKSNKKYKNNSSNYSLDWLKEDPYFNGDEAYLSFLKAIQILPSKQKIVFSLKYFEELKYSEIAEILNTSEGSLKASYHHAVKKIEDYITIN